MKTRMDGKDRPPWKTRLMEYLKIGSALIVFLKGLLDLIKSLLFFQAIEADPKDLTLI